MITVPQGEVGVTGYETIRILPLFLETTLFRVPQGTVWGRPGPHRPPRNRHQRAAQSPEGGHRTAGGPGALRTAVELAHRRTAAEVAPHRTAGAGRRTAEVGHRTGCLPAGQGAAGRLPGRRKAGARRRAGQEVEGRLPEGERRKEGALPPAEGDSRPAGERRWGAGRQQRRCAAWGVRDWERLAQRDGEYRGVPGVTGGYRSSPSLTCKAHSLINNTQFLILTLPSGRVA